MQNKYSDISKVTSYLISPSKQLNNDDETPPKANTTVDYNTNEKKIKYSNQSSILHRASDTPNKQNCFDIQFKYSNEKDKDKKKNGTVKMSR